MPRRRRTAHRAPWVTLVLLGQAVVLFAAPVGRCCATRPPAADEAPKVPAPCCCTGEDVCRCGPGCAEPADEPPTGWGVVLNARPCVCGFPDAAAGVADPQIAPPAATLIADPPPARAVFLPTFRSEPAVQRPPVPPPRS